jgi:hypothetical protein
MPGPSSVGRGAKCLWSTHHPTASATTSVSQSKSRMVKRRRMWFYFFGSLGLILVLPSRIDLRRSLIFSCTSLVWLIIN